MRDSYVPRHARIEPEMHYSLVHSNPLSDWPRILIGERYEDGSIIADEPVYTVYNLDREVWGLALLHELWPDDHQRWVNEIEIYFGRH